MKLKNHSHKVIISLLLSSTLQAKTPAFKNAYLHRFEAIAIKEMKRSGVPASITLAQGILESGWGKSPLTRVSNNHFGIKCHAGWSGERHQTMSESSAEVIKTTCYRAYTNAEESYKDHTDFLLKNALYRPLFSNRDYQSWAVGLESLGYAHDDNYAELLVSIIECNELYKYDILIDSPYNEQELMNLPTQELFAMIRFALFGEPQTLSQEIKDVEWAELNKEEAKWFDMGLQPLVFEQRRRKSKNVEQALENLWI